MLGDVSTVGRYAIVGRLASGGMGIVYRARLAGEGGFVRDFALKKLHSHLAEDRDAVEMFLDEARLAAMIRHPNVVATVDVGREDGGFYVVMDLIEGVSAIELLRSGAVPVGVAARIILDVLDGLSAAHGAVDPDGQLLEIVHRDVSPANILIGRDGIAKLTDFGIAKARERLRTTVGVEVKGKLGYMPPEQLEGGDVDARADLFSTGVVLWELLVGESLLHGNRGRLRELEASERPSWFSTPAGAGVDAIIARALALSPHARFSNAREMSEALRRAVGEQLASATEVGEHVLALMENQRPAEPPSSRRFDVQAAAWAVPSSPTANIVDAPAWSSLPRALADHDATAARGEPTAMLREVAAWGPTEASPAKADHARESTPRRSRRGLAIALGAALAVVVVVTIGFVTMRRPSPEPAVVLAAQPSEPPPDPPPSASASSAPLSPSASAHGAVGSALRPQAAPRKQRAAPPREAPDRFGGRH